VLAVRIKEPRAEQEEAERRRRAWETERTEKLRFIREEEEGVKALYAEADAWHRRRRLRVYLDAVRAAAIAEHGEVQQGSDLDRWLVWAADQADRIDPLAESPPSILDEKGKYGGLLVPRGERIPERLPLTVRLSDRCLRVQRDGDGRGIANRVGRGR
jgi:hypothetical protein